MRTRTAIGKIAMLMAMVLACAMVFSGCTEKPQEQAEFKVGMECAYAPFNWTQTDDSNGAVEISGGGFAGGYDVEIAKKVAEGLGRKLVIVKTDWDGLLPSLTSDKIDAIIAGMSPTAERRESIDFSDYYYSSELVVVVKKDGAYADAKTLEDFSGARITGQLNTFHYSVVDQLTGVDKQTAMEDFPTMIAALGSNKIDGYVSEEPGAQSAVASNPDLTYIKFEKGFEYEKDDVALSIGLKKGSELATKINEILKGIPDSERESLMEAAKKNQPTSD